MRALRMFAPQIFGVALSTGCGMGWAALWAAHPIAVVPFAVTAIVSGLATFITTIAKVSDVEIYGWSKVDPPRACKRCTALAADLAETRKALLELRP